MIVYVLCFNIAANNLFTPQIAFTNPERDTTNTNTKIQIVNILEGESAELRCFFYGK
jgi:hypothetical protein